MLCSKVPFVWSGMKFIPACHFASSSSNMKMHFGGLEPLRWDGIAHDVHADCFDLASQLQIVQLHLSEVFKPAVFAHLRDCKSSCHRTEVSTPT